MTPAHPDAAPIDAPPPTPDGVVRASRAVALIGLIGLIVLGLAWELWLAPTGSGTLAIKVLPLVFCVLGLLRHRMYTFRWLSLLVWLYFTEGVVRAVTEQGMSRWLAVLEILLCLLLFTSSALYIRWRLSHAPLASASASADPVTP